MAIGEFSIIEKYFSGLGAPVEGVALGVGDDCALLDIPPGYQLAVTTDALSEGVHFPADSPANLVAYRALCTNLSDLAAMGAEPRWFQLALTLPDADETWLASFSSGLAQCAAEYECQLIGGDITRGSLNLAFTMMGVVPTGAALLRSGARAGDEIYVSGTLGDAYAALEKQYLTDENRINSDYLLSRFWKPTPRLRLAGRLRGVASAAIDISDGLGADVGHILQASRVGAEIQFDRLPVSPQSIQQFGARRARMWALSAGDDYELCFTAAADKAEAIASIAGETGVPVTRIGRIVNGTELVCVDNEGLPVVPDRSGYNHFSEA